MAMTYEHAHATTATPFSKLIADAARLVRGWLTIWRTENELADLSPRQLADIGLVGPHLPASYRRAVLEGRHYS